MQFINFAELGMKFSNEIFFVCIYACIQIERFMHSHDIILNNQRKDLFLLKSFQTMNIFFCKIKRFFTSHGDSPFILNNIQFLIDILPCKLYFHIGIGLNENTVNSSETYPDEFVAYLTRFLLTYDSTCNQFYREHSSQFTGLQG